MTVNRPEPQTLSLGVRAAGDGLGRLGDGLREIGFHTAATTPQDPRFAGASVILRTPDQFASAIALIALDGVARRIVITPPDLDEGDLEDVAVRAKADAVVYGADGEGRLLARFDPPRSDTVDSGAVRSGPTEWVLFTSGTSGTPKMAVHTLQGLAGAIRPTELSHPVWATFYDIRRYGGLQMFLRAALGGGTLVMSRAGEAAADFLARARSWGVTHLTGTPTHWRQALRCGELDTLELHYARLSGEIADQVLLDRMKARLGPAPIGHAYASTEAGVVFEVNDGLEGFPLAYFSRPPPFPEMRLKNGALQVRSARSALGYLGEVGPLHDDEGFVDTGDMVEIDGDRCRFLGRRGGVVNVGGLKVHPEEVERVVARHPQVRACRAGPRKNPVTGAVVALDVVADADADVQALTREILDLCRDALAPHKVPATVRMVEALSVSAAGKLERAHA